DAARLVAQDEPVGARWGGAVEPGQDLLVGAADADGQRADLRLATPAPRQRDVETAGTAGLAGEHRDRGHHSSLAGPPPRWHAFAEGSAAIGSSEKLARRGPMRARSGPCRHPAGRPRPAIAGRVVGHRLGCCSWGWGSWRSGPRPTPGGAAARGRVL